MQGRFGIGRRGLQEVSARAAASIGCVKPSISFEFYASAVWYIATDAAALLAVTSAHHRVLESGGHRMANLDRRRTTDHLGRQQSVVTHCPIARLCPAQSTTVGRQFSSGFKTRTGA